MEDKNEYFITILLLGIVTGLGLFLIRDDDFIQELFGVITFGVGLGGLFLISIDKLIIELKPKIQNIGDVK